MNEEPFMHTDELIDLYSADPVTGRAKDEEEDSEEEEFESESENKFNSNPFTPVKEKEEVKVMEKVDKVEETDLRREYPIEKALPSLFAQGILF